LQGWHRSFEEAWRSLEMRSEPLGTLAELLPADDGHVVRVWLAAVADQPAAAMAAVQAQLAPLTWLQPLPRHLLHVTLGRVEAAEPDRAALAGLAPFRLTFGPVNALHGAVVAEIGGDTGALRRAVTALAPAVDLDTFLPHATLGVFWEPAPPAELRAALKPLRGAALGEQVVSELLLCDVPGGQGTFGQPWTVVERLTLM
jgi:hypothetical protein